MAYRFIMLIFLATIASVSLAADRVYTIQDAYESALGTNEIVKIAEEGVVQAESIVDQAWTYVYPRVTGEAGYTRYNEILPPSGGFVFQPLDDYRVSVTLTQPLYTGGRTFAALRTAKKLRAVSRGELTATKQDTLLNVAEAYYGVLKAQRLTAVSRASLERMKRHRAVAQREAETRKTKANISALLRANTLVSQSGIILTRSGDALRIARRKLSLLTRLPGDAIIGEPALLERPARELEELLQTALANREEYKNSVLNQDVAKENIKIVKGAHYPQAYAEGAWSNVGSDPETLLEGTTYYGGIRLQIPIFEGGLMKAEVSEARSRLRQAELSSEFLRRSIETEVYEAYVNLQTFTSVLKAAGVQHEDARNNFSTVEDLFSQGLASSLALIDAQQALLLAERQYVNARYEQQIAILRLNRSTGQFGRGF